MKPLNLSTRRSLYFRFLLFYILSILIVIIAMHFFYSVPEKQLEFSKHEIEKYAKYEANGQALLKYAKSQDSILDTWNDLGNPEIILNNLTTNQNQMGNSLSSKNSAVDSIYMFTLNNYIKRYLDKKSFLTSQDRMKNMPAINTVSSP